MYGVENRFKMQLLLGLKGSPLRRGNPTTKDYTSGKKHDSTVEELKQSQAAMDTMMAHNQYQGQLVQDMTEQVQRSETKLHSYKVQELYDKRKRELEAKIREEETSKQISSKDQMLNQLSLELFETRDRLGNIKKDLDGPSLLQNSGGP